MGDCDGVVVCDLVCYGMVNEMILVVDDEFDVCVFVWEVFEFFGYIVFDIGDLFWVYVFY